MTAHAFGVFFDHTAHSGVPFWLSPENRISWPCFAAPPHTKLIQYHNYDYTQSQRWFGVFLCRQWWRSDLPTLLKLILARRAQAPYMFIFSLFAFRVFFFRVGILLIFQLDSEDRNTFCYSAPDQGRPFYIFIISTFKTRVNKLSVPGQLQTRVDW